MTVEAKLVCKVALCPASRLALALAVGLAEAVPALLEGVAARGKRLGSMAADAILGARQEEYLAAEIVHG